VSPVKYELNFYIPEDDILHDFRYRPHIPSKRHSTPAALFSGTFQKMLFIGEAARNTNETNEHTGTEYSIV
jgi:hypothetical protein